MAEAGKVTTDPLFVGLTRPPLLLGVSYSYFILNIAPCFILYILTNKFTYILILAPLIHAFGYFIHSKEPLIIDLIRVRAGKCSRCNNRYLVHGANSYDPF